LLKAPDQWRYYFEQYGGVFIAETLMTAVTELKEAYEKYKTDASFLAEFEDDLKHYDCCRCHAMLTSTCLGNDAGFTHAFC
jgi:tryptophan synthase beta subunit